MIVYLNMYQIIEVCFKSIIENWIKHVTAKCNQYMSMNRRNSTFCTILECIRSKQFKSHVRKQTKRKCPRDAYSEGCVSYHCVEADDRGIYNGHHKMADPKEGKFCFVLVSRSTRIFCVMCQCR